MLVLGIVDLPVWFLLGSCLLIVFLWYNTRHFNYFKKQGIDGVRPIPIFGSLRLWGRTKEIFPWGDVELKKYGDIVSYFMGSRPGLFVFDEDFLSQVLVKDFVNFSDRVDFSPGDKVGDATLLKAHGKHWKHMRTIMTPTFSTGKLKRMMTEIDRCGVQLARNLTELGSQEVEMKDFAGGYTIDVIASTAFGIRIDSQKEETNIFVKMTKKVFTRSTASALMIIVARFAPIFMPILKLLDMNSMFPKDVRRFFTDVIKQTIEVRNDEGGENRSDFLQLMLNVQRGEDIRDSEDVKDESGNAQTTEAPPNGGLSTHEILANSLLFFTVGFDTTASTLAFLLYCLALNPDCQQRVVEEIQRVVGDKEVLTYDSLSEMTYLDQCVCETLRLFPPLPRTNRVAQRDVTVNGVHLKKGMVVTIPIFGIHHDQTKWPEPEHFRPERFSTENKVKRSPFHWMPFGYGPRTCIANRLAVVEVKAAAIHILQKIRVSTCRKTQVPMKFKIFAFLKAKGGIWLRMEPRK